MSPVADDGFGSYIRLDYEYLFVYQTCQSTFKYLAPSDTHVSGKTKSMVVFAVFCQIMRELVSIPGKYTGTQRHNK